MSVVKGFQFSTIKKEQRGEAMISVEIEGLPRKDLLKRLSDPSAPYELLEWALSHESWALRQTACDNQNLPESLMLLHYRRFGWLELIILVNKKQVPREILEYISMIAPDIRPHTGAYDWNKDLRDIACKRLGLSEKSERMEEK